MSKVLQFSTGLVIGFSPKKPSNINRKRARKTKKTIKWFCCPPARPSALWSGF